MKELPDDIRRELENARQSTSTSFASAEAKNRSPVAAPQAKHTRASKSPNKSPSKNRTATTSPNGKRGRGRPRKVDKTMDTNKYGSIFDTMNRTKLVKSSTNSVVNDTVRVSQPKPLQKLPDNFRRADGPGFLSPDKIDVDVLNELPSEIRTQIWSDLKKTSMNFKKQATHTEQSFSVSLKNVTSPSKKRSSSSTITSGSATGGIVRAGNSRVPDIVSPSQLDASFLRAIPEEMRSEIIAESENAKKRKLEFESLAAGAERTSNRRITVAGTTVVNTTNTGKHYKTDFAITDTGTHSIPPPHQCSVLNNISSSEVNQSILDALPGTVRDEILNETRHHPQYVLGNGLNNNTVDLSKQGPHSFREIPPALPVEETLVNEISLFPNC